MLYKAPGVHAVLSIVFNLRRFVCAKSETHNTVRSDLCETREPSRADVLPALHRESSWRFAFRPVVLCRVHLNVPHRVE